MSWNWEYFRKPEIRFRSLIPLILKHFSNAFASNTRRARRWTVAHSGNCVMESVDSGQVALTVVSLQGWLLPFKVNGRWIQQQCFHMRWWIAWYWRVTKKKENLQKEPRLFFIKQIPFQSNIEIRKTSESLRSDKDRNHDKLNLDLALCNRVNEIEVYLHYSFAVHFFAEHFPNAKHACWKHRPMESIFGHFKMSKWSFEYSAFCTHTNERWVRDCMISTVKNVLSTMQSNR